MPDATPERPYAVLVHEEDATHVLCNPCASRYVGDAETEELAQENVGDVLLCDGCGADLANPEEVGYDDE
jgi:hypothetical protein